MKRIFLFLITNIAVVLVLTVLFHVVCRLLGIDPGAIHCGEYDYKSLAIYALIFGMAGSLISLLMSKHIAKASTGAMTIAGTEGPAEAWLVNTVQDLANRAGIKCPEVAIYEGEPNAFATGAFKNSALVAVSTGIMQSMTKNELRAVLGHEMSHVSNGDMVTMTLVQGVLNAFVLFISRIIGSILGGMLSGKGKNRNNGLGMLFSHIIQIALGFAASIVVRAYSRHREYAADAGSANLLGSPSDMIAALRRLGNLQPGVLPDSLKAMGISGSSISALFSTHPSLEDRIEALQRL